MSRRSISRTFTHPQDDALIEFMSMHPELYDAQSENYKKVFVRNEQWTQCAKVCGRSGTYIYTQFFLARYIAYIFKSFPVTDCKARWRYLRDYFTRVKNKKGDTRKSSAFLQRLSFLDLDGAYFAHELVTCDDDAQSQISELPSPTTFVRHLKRNAENALNELLDTYNDDSQSQISDEPQSPTIKIAHQRRNADAPNDPLDTAATSLTVLVNPVDMIVASSVAAPSPTPNKRARKNDEQPLHDLVTEGQPNRLNELFESLTNALSERPKDDELTTFFRSMEQTARKLPKHLQLKVKRGVSDVLYNAEEEHLLLTGEETQLHDEKPHQTYQ